MTSLLQGRISRTFGKTRVYCWRDVRLLPCQKVSTSRRMIRRDCWSARRNKTKAYVVANEATPHQHLTFTIPKSDPRSLMMDAFTVTMVTMVELLGERKKFAFWSKTPNRYLFLIGISRFSATWACSFVFFCLSNRSSSFTGLVDHMNDVIQPLCRVVKKQDNMTETIFIRHSCNYNQSYHHYSLSTRGQQDTKEGVSA